MLIICTMREECLREGCVVELVSWLCLHWLRLLLIIHKELIPWLGEWWVVRGWNRVREWKALVYLRHIRARWMLGREIPLVIILILVFWTRWEIWLSPILLQFILRLLDFQVLRNIENVSCSVCVRAEVIMREPRVMVGVHNQLLGWLGAVVHHSLIIFYF